MSSISEKCPCFYESLTKMGLSCFTSKTLQKSTIKSRYKQQFCQVGVIAKVLWSVWEESFRSMDKEAAGRAAAWAVSGPPLQLSGILKHVSSLCLGKTEMCSSDNCVTACTVMYVSLGAWCARKEELLAQVSLWTPRWQKQCVLQETWGFL